MHQNRSHKLKRRNGMKMRETSTMPHCLKSIPPATKSQILCYGINDLPTLYKRLFNTTGEVKLAMFQFNIIRNIIYTKDELKKAKLATCDLCYLCKCDTHTLQHMLVRCPHVQYIWHQFCVWWQNNTTKHLNLRLF